MKLKEALERFGSQMSGIGDISDLRGAVEAINAGKPIPPKGQFMNNLKLSELQGLLEKGNPEFFDQANFIDVRPGHGSYWNPYEQRIVVDPKDYRGHGLRSPADIIQSLLHEGTHTFTDGRELPLYATAELLAQPRGMEVPGLQKFRDILELKYHSQPQEITPNVSAWAVANQIHPGMVTKQYPQGFEGAAQSMSDEIQNGLRMQEFIEHLKRFGL